MNQLRDWIFRQVHTRNLVYNTCWEDPRIDRQLLNLDQNSELVMITSAGCNALDYLLDDPRQINCIDVNPRQNALLQLKLAALNYGTFEDLFHLFGNGNHPDAKKLYREHLRSYLPDYATEYWDKNLNFFNGKGIRKTFYHYSTSGTFAWLAKQYLKVRKNLRWQIDQLFNSETLEQQQQIYFDIEKRVLNPLVEWVVNRHFTMCLVGVPRSQQLLFRDDYQKGAVGFIQECMRKVFTEITLKDNYFWRLYWNGSYDTECCPSYLMEENFETLKDRTNRVGSWNQTISGFLQEHPNAYSHYILLDHQDWLAANNVPALEEEWRLILQNSKPGTKILLRSAARDVDFFPSFVEEAIDFQKEELDQLHKEDRVGTYASVYLGTVK